MKPYLTRDQHRLYKLIWERFVASQMAPAILDTIALDVTQNDIKFRANGQTIKFKGFMTLYVEAKDDKDNEKRTNFRNLRKEIKLQLLKSNLLNTLLNHLLVILKHV